MQRSPSQLALLAACLAWLSDGEQSHAQGTIRYVPGVNLGFQVGDTLWDVDGDGSAEFIYRFDGRSLAVFPQANSYVLSFAEPPPDIGADVVPLAVPSEIGSYDYTPAEWVGLEGNLGFPGRSYFNACSFNGCVGTFVGISAYFGFSFQIEGQTHYGWASFQSYSTTLPSGVLEEYAFNLTPDAPIFVGQVPEPSTWALLASGGLALLLIKRRRYRHVER